MPTFWNVRKRRNGFEEIVEHGAPRAAPVRLCPVCPRYPRRVSNTPRGIGMLATYTKKR